MKWKTQNCNKLTFLGSSKLSDLQFHQICLCLFDNIKRYCQRQYNKTIIRQNNIASKELLPHLNF